MGVHYIRLRGNILGELTLLFPLSDVIFPLRDVIFALREYILSLGALYSP